MAWIKGFASHFLEIIPAYKENDTRELQQNYQNPSFYIVLGKCVRNMACCKSSALSINRFGCCKINLGNFMNNDNNKEVTEKESDQS